MVRPLRAWALTTDIRSLIAFHLIRFVGFYFLFLYSLGELPYNFAVFGGWGDIAVAVLALVVMFFCAKSRSALVVWKYRVGDYRIIASIEHKLVRILVVRIGIRREVHR